MQPLCIVGTQRSGSNLLRLLLNQLDEVLAPHPPHILQVFYPLLNRYGNLKHESNFNVLVNDVCQYVLANPVPWLVNGLTPANIKARCRANTLINVYRAVYEIYAAEKGKQIWCCKSMANLYYIPQLEEEGLKPIYIHLIRDGRDVACSFLKAIVGEKHVYHLAAQWKQDQDTTEHYCLQYAPERYVPVMYENLIHDPESTLRILLHHLGLHFKPEMLDFYKTDEAKATAGAGKMWGNVQQPIMEKNSNKFLKQLTDEQIRIFEGVAGDTLQRLGYTPYFSANAWKTTFTQQELDAYNLFNDKFKKEEAEKLDPEGVQKRKAQEAIVAGIKARQPISEAV